MCQKIKMKPLPLEQLEAVSFDVSANQLSFHDSKNNLIVENGEFDLWISTNSNSGSPQMFILK